MKELPSIFKGLKIHKIKSRRRGNQLLGYEFTFKKALKNGWTISLIIMQKNKNVPPGSKTPDWYDPDYKNRNYSESIKELERIKQESLDRMKN